MSCREPLDGGGIFTISLDFELFWGLRDILAPDECRETLLGARRAVPEILAQFSEYGIHATWATVGFLFCSGREELLGSLPKLLPTYENSSLSPYGAIAETGNSEREDPLHYAPSIIEHIASLPGQELATHTFSHYYCLEQGQTVEAFRADLEAARRIASRRGVELRSLVFPRNQFNENYLAICRELGIVAYRGNQRSWMYRATTTAGESGIRRAARLADAYLNLSGHNGHPVASPGDAAPLNIPASRLLRPVSARLKPLEALRLRRITREMEHAARHNLIYHLWWHPHNFGADVEASITFLRGVLEQFRKLEQQYGMRSMNMAEIAQRRLPA